MCHPSNYIETEASTATGYKVKWSTDSSFSTSISGLDDYDSFYNIESSDEDNIVAGLWMASPANYDADDAMLVDYNGDVMSNIYNDPYGGARPIIALKPGIGVEIAGPNEYELVQ